MNEDIEMAQVPMYNLCIAFDTHEELQDFLADKNRATVLHDLLENLRFAAKHEATEFLNVYRDDKYKEPKPCIYTCEYIYRWLRDYLSEEGLGG